MGILLLERMEEDPRVKNGRHSFREKLWEIIFEAETPSGKAFDVMLLIAIGLSVVAVMLESVNQIEANWADQLHALEWFFTILFTAEYFLRLWLVRRPMRYAFSFFGIVDLLSCLPTYLAIFFVGAQSLLVIRILRLLRMFRVLKMVHHVRGADVIMRGLMASRAKITVFFFSMLVFAVIVGTIIYLVEGSENIKFDNIPASIYWAIVTMTTLGYGDLTLGEEWRMLAAYQAASGIIVFGWTTAIIVAVIQRMTRHPLPGKSQSR